MGACFVDLPGCYPVGRKVKLRADCSGQLVDGALLSGTPVVVEEGGSTVSIGTPVINADEVEIGNKTLAAGQAITCPIEVMASQDEKTVIKVTCDTTDTDQNIVQRIRFKTE